MTTAPLASTARTRTSATRARGASRKAKPVDANELMAAQVSEASVQKAVMDYLRAMGYLVAHFPDSRKQQGDTGVTDLFIVGRGRVIFAEMKRQNGRRSPQQLIWASALRETAAEYYCWRPLDWRNGTIERIVRMGRS